MHSLGVREKSDERILGNGEFVEQLIQRSDQAGKEQFSDHERRQCTVSHVHRICKKEYGFDVMISNLNHKHH